MVYFPENETFESLERDLSNQMIVLFFASGRWVVHVVESFNNHNFSTVDTMSKMF